ncbi:MAG: hypothetical protein QXH07_03605 [Thermoplasmata archaeon]
MENKEKRWKVVDINGVTIKKHLTYNKANELAEQYNDELHGEPGMQNACDIYIVVPDNAWYNPAHQGFGLNKWE